MPSEKFFVHKEDGSLVRLKGRLVRFLDEEPPTGSDKSAIRTALEVSPDAEGLVQADVGTDPNQLVLHQHLGDISYQSADSVSVDTLEVTDKVDGSLGIDVTPTASKLEISGTTNSSLMLTRTSSGVVSNLEDAAGHGSFLLYTAGGGAQVSVQANGNSYFNGGSVGIGTASPGDLSAAANNLVVGSGSGNEGLTIFSGSANEAAIYFADGTAGNQAYRSYIVCQHASDNLVFGTAGTTRWTINSTGNLVAGSGLGIDFGSTSDGSGTMSSELLDDYEEGTWSPAFSMTGGDFTTAPTMDIVAARYVKVGHMVTFYAYLRTDSVDITGAGGSLAVEGLPYANAGSNNYAAINVGQANFWTNAPSGGYVYSGGDYIVLTKRNTGITGSMTEMQAADLTAGVTANQNQLMISVIYFSF